MARDERRAQVLRIACANGHLMSLPAEGRPTASLVVTPDLRDVLFTPAGVLRLPLPPSGESAAALLDYLDGSLGELVKT